MDSLADECCQWPCCTYHKVSAYSRSWENDKKWYQDYIQLPKYNINFTLNFTKTIWTSNSILNVHYLWYKKTLFLKIDYWKALFSDTKTLFDHFFSTSPFSVIARCFHLVSVKDFDATLRSPFCVIVNENIVFHCQFEVWDLLTHPPRESTHIRSSLYSTPDMVIYSLCECGCVHELSERG